MIRWEQKSDSETMVGINDDEFVDFYVKNSSNWVGLYEAMIREKIEWCEENNIEYYVVTKNSGTFYIPKEAERIAFLLRFG